jgi:hypothetical protein
MTEAEWPTTTSLFALMTARGVVTTPRKMQLFGKDVVIQETVSTPLISFAPRKIRLFGVACCYRASQRLPPVFLDLLLGVARQVDTMKSTVELAGLHTKGGEELEKLRAAERNGYRPGVVSAAEAVVFTADPDVAPVEFGVNLSNNLACSAGEVARKKDVEDRWPPEVETATDAERAVHCAIFRDILGNPLRPVTVDPSWLVWNGGTVVKLALSIYDDWAFDRLPVLADALEEAGRDNADILNHCHQPGEHVRGCWAVDQVLNKE